jgi:hypothetical protein
MHTAVIPEAERSEGCPGPKNTNRCSWIPGAGFARPGMTPLPTVIPEAERSEAVRDP